MLNAVTLLIAATVQVLASVGPQLPDHRTQFTVQPAELAIIHEWKCARDAKLVRLKINTRDIGGPTRNATFTTELIDLKLGGQLAPLAYRNKIKAAMREINTVPAVKTECLGDHPSLLLYGYRQREGDYQPVSLALVLR